MAEYNQQARIEAYIRDIIEVCRSDPAKLEVAIVNFQSLLDAMKLYGRSPKYYNNFIEDAEKNSQLTQHFPYTGNNRKDNDPYKFPVVGELEKIYGRKLKQTELQALGVQLASKTGLKLERDTKRSKPLLLQWFYKNWTTLKPKIHEFNLNNMNFTK